MKIEEVLPYFIEKANNEKEFKEIQIKLFAKGYKWMNTMTVFTHNMIIYPILVSNIPESPPSTKEIRLRNNFKEFSNNIIFFNEYKKYYKITYDKNIMRKVKMQKLSTNVLS